MKCFRSNYSPSGVPEKGPTMDRYVRENPKRAKRERWSTTCFFGLSLGLAVFWCLMPPFCVGEEKSPRNVVFSLSASSERLDAVLEKISKASGYSITVNEGWRSKVVTVRLENVTVDEGLKILIDALGKPSHLLLYDETHRKIEMVMVPGSLSSSESTGRAESPTRPVRQIGPVGPEGRNPTARTYPRRTRPRVLQPPSAPEELQEQGREEIPAGQAEAENKAGDTSSETAESPEEGAPDRKQKGASEPRQKPGETSENQSAPSSP